VVFDKIAWDVRKRFVGSRKAFGTRLLLCGVLFVATLGFEREKELLPGFLINN